MVKDKIPIETIIGSYLQLIPISGIGEFFISILCIPFTSTSVMQENALIGDLNCIKECSLGFTPHSLAFHIPYMPEESRIRRLFQGSLRLYQYCCAFFHDWQAEKKYRVVQDLY